MAVLDVHTLDLQISCRQCSVTPIRHHTCALSLETISLHWNFITWTGRHRRGHLTRTMKTMKMQKWPQYEIWVLSVLEEERAGVRMKAQIIVRMLKQEAHLMAVWGAAAQTFVKTVKDAAQRWMYDVMVNLTFRKWKVTKLMLFGPSTLQFFLVSAAADEGA